MMAPMGEDGGEQPSVHSVESSSLPAAALGLMQRPHIGADEFGAATFEWWNGDRKLTFYTIGNPYEQLLKSWGPNIHSDMEFVSVLDSVQVREAFAWLDTAPKAQISGSDVTEGSVQMNKEPVSPSPNAQEE